MVIEDASDQWCYQTAKFRGIGVIIVIVLSLSQKIGIRDPMRQIIFDTTKEVHGVQPKERQMMEYIGVTNRTKRDNHFCCNWTDTVKMGGGIIKLLPY